MMDNTILYYNAKLIIVMQPEIATAEEAGRRFVIAAEVQNLASISFLYGKLSYLNASNSK